MRIVQVDNRNFLPNTEKKRKQTITLIRWSWEKVLSPF